MDIKKLNLPISPGIYKFFNVKGELIYIGKAANLKSRVSSYWRESAGHSPAKYSMVKQITEVKWIETESEIEALLLEANLIKKFHPPYNIVMRDDKRHVYIKISAEVWPRIFMTRILDHSGKYFGPFVSTESVCETLKVIRKIWPYRSCSHLPKRACLYYALDKCPGMCEGKADRNKYLSDVKKIILFLQGEKKRVILNFKFEILNLGKKLKKLKNTDEEYIKTKDKVNYLNYQLNNLNKVLDNAKIISLGDKYAADAVELAKTLSLPRVPERIEGFDIANLFGREAVGSMVVFKAGEPDKSGYRKFKIKIGQGEANDVGMLKEILERRFNNDWPWPDLIIIDGGKAQLNVALGVLKKFKLDIFLIAVSKGEGLRSAMAPDKLWLRHNRGLELASLNHKLFFPGEKKPLELPLASPALHLIKRVRDEAHRFAITYHKKLRKKSFLG
jgi:excinuclease ABC subunit C